MVGWRKKPLQDWLSALFEGARPRICLVDYNDSNFGSHNRLKTLDSVRWPSKISVCYLPVFKVLGACIIGLTLKFLYPWVLGHARLQGNLVTREHYSIVWITCHDGR